jgi:hypothetical protein
VALGSDPFDDINGSAARGESINGADRDRAYSLIPTCPFGPDASFCYAEFTGIRPSGQSCIKFLGLELFLVFCVCRWCGTDAGYGATYETS